MLIFLWVSQPLTKSKVLLIHSMRKISKASYHLQDEDHYTSPYTFEIFNCDLKLYIILTMNTSQYYWYYIHPFFYSTIHQSIILKVYDIFYMIVLNFYWSSFLKKFHYSYIIFLRLWHLTHRLPSVGFIQKEHGCTKDITWMVY